MNSVQGGLAVNGTMLVIGAVDTLAVDALLLLRGRHPVKGWYSGTSLDSEETLAIERGSLDNFKIKSPKN